MATTQQGRMMGISTPLGEDFLLINKMSATEALSELFRFDVELLREEDEAAFEPTIVDVKKILGQSVAIKVLQRDGTTRVFNGMVARFSQGNRDTRFSYYYATIVPHVWLLTQISQSRIFQQQTVPDILKRVFQGFEVKWEIQGTFKPRNYCVQYRETDFAFASRLMEEEGIFYFFEHTDEGHKMIVANEPLSHPNCPSKNEIPFFLEVGDEESFVSSIGTWRFDYKLQSGKVTLWDFNFQLPKKKLEAEQPALVQIGGNEELEIYDYPAGYARKYDGIDKSGSEQASDLQNVFDDNKKTAKVRMQELDAQYKTVTGMADCCAMTAGFRFKLLKHPNKEFNVQYTLLSVSHQMEQSPNYVSEEEVPNPYGNSFTCIMHGGSNPPFRPPQKTPKPVIHGSQTAFVVGPPGEEIFTDKYGRVKVQFHWDREGQLDANSSCWVRVTQAWAGNRWGMMFIPRIGQEVRIDFLEGDPDQPIITGCVYNAEAMPPYTLPDEKTKMTIKSDSTVGGQGFNELRFEDKKGKEQIFIHAEKNMDVRVKNDGFEYLEKDRHLIVKNDQYEKVHKDKHLQVGGDRNENVDGSLSLKVGTDIDEKAGAKFALEAGTEIHLKSGTNLTIETGTSLTLKVGGNFININAGGIFIKGTMVFVNSGGAAGSGSGVSLEVPKDPKEADKADPGARVTLPKPSPPPARPVINSPAALALINAAQHGTAFCEICSRSAAAPQPAPVEVKAVKPEPEQPPPAPPPPAPAETKKEQKKAWIEIILVDMDGNPMPGVKYRITPPGGGEPKEGVLNEHGQAGYYQIEPGKCEITFPDLDKDAWE